MGQCLLRYTSVEMVLSQHCNSSAAIRTLIPITETKRMPAQHVCCNTSFNHGDKKNASQMDIDHYKFLIWAAEDSEGIPYCLHA